MPRPRGHALEPGYLELRLLDKELYAVVWKTPVNKSRPMNISAVLPERCDARTPAESVWDGTAYVARWTTRCTGGLEGGVIRIDGLDQTRTDVLVRFDFANGINESRRLIPSESSFTVPTIPSRLEAVRTYLVLGFQHTLSGIDHLMFVLALLILVKGTGRLIVTVTAFTLAAFRDSRSPRPASGHQGSCEFGFRCNNRETSPVSAPGPANSRTTSGRETLYVPIRSGAQRRGGRSRSATRAHRHLAHSLVRKPGAGCLS